MATSETRINDEYLTNELLGAQISSDGDEIDRLMMSLAWAARIGSPELEELLKVTPFVPFTSLLDGRGWVDLFPAPNMTSRYETDVHLVKYAEAYNGQCAIVRGTANEQPLVFFDPQIQEHDYREIINPARIGLIAVGTGPVFEPEAPYEEGEARITRTTYFGQLGYEGVFQVLEQLEVRGDYALVEVENPFAPGSRMELVAHLDDELKAGDLPREIETEVYFIGSLAHEW